MSHPWKNTATKKTFAEADVVRNEILEDETMQAKVKRYVDEGVERFVVKSRKNPAIIAEENLVKDKKRNRKQKRDKKEGKVSSEW
jgi:hypothetical protein